MSRPMFYPMGTMAVGDSATMPATDKAQPSALVATSVNMGSATINTLSVEPRMV
jgi:hypothetical protein